MLLNNATALLGVKGFTSQVGYYAGKPTESAVYCLHGLKLH